MSELSQSQQIASVEETATAISGEKDPKTEMADLKKSIRAEITKCKVNEQLAIIDTFIKELLYGKPEEDGDAEEEFVCDLCECENADGKCTPEACNCPPCKHYIEKFGSEL